MYRICFTLALIGMVPLMVGAAAGQGAEGPQAMPVPTLPFVDWKACPGEGCQYGRWTARRSVVVYDTWKDNRRPIARLAKGDRVVGLTGVVVTYKPGVILIDRDMPEEGLQRGDTILTYAYRGEGLSAVWFKGSYYPDFDISFAKWPEGGGCGSTHCAATYLDLGKKVWWAEIKLNSGRTGWVNMNEAEFDGTCAIARSMSLRAVMGHQ